MTEKKEALPLQRIAKSIDTLISKNGSEKTADYLETISIADSLQFDGTAIDLQKFIYTETVRQFEIKPSRFESCYAEAYIKARATCFYLLSVHCNLSTNSIRLKFPKLKHTRSYVYTCIQKTNDIVKTPAVDKKWHALYLSINEKVLEYKKSVK